jgi:hypothetical protein
MDAEMLFHQVGRMIQSMPEFKYGTPLLSDDYLWLGRAGALVEKYCDIGDKVVWESGINFLGGTASHEMGVKNIKSVIYKLLAIAELKAPPHVRGTFIPAGHVFDAFVAVSKALKPAREDILVVDPYMDEAVLTEFGGAVPEGIPLRLLADKADYKSSLKTAATKWSSQYGASRPLAVRLSAPKALHDRAIFLDRKVAWTITQSLKDMAKRSHAELLRADDIAARKVPAYEAIWSTAEVVI